jgi:hypothetical protein
MDGVKVVDHIVYYWLVAYKKPCVVEMFLHKVTMQGFARLGEVIAT